MILNLKHIIIAALALSDGLTACGAEKGKEGGNSSKASKKSGKKTKKAPKLPVQPPPDEVDSDYHFDPKDAPTVPLPKGELQKRLQKAQVERKAIQIALGFDASDAQQCLDASDDHQECRYEVLTPGSNFMCECRPTNGANVFRAVDVNEDDIITLQEVLDYFDSETCVFPFKYEIDGVVNTYNECTTDDDAFGFSWCSVETLADGTHAKGFWKYCEDSTTEIVYQDALNRLDENNDGQLSFAETINNARRRRRKLTGSAGGCRDCNDAPEDCQNIVINAMDGECRNYVKTVPLDDENLLHMLAATMLDSYCTEPSGDGDVHDYEYCPHKRKHMDEWITRTHLEPYKKMNDKQLETLKFLLCQAVVVFNDHVNELLPPLLVGVYNFMVALDIEFFDTCVYSLGNPNVSSNLLDGKDALQWATYKINKGEHEGETILAIMGTDFDNVEQVVADIWSVPRAAEMMKNMANEAKEIALREKPNYITGHSLGGRVAEMVCSMTGIPGASFGAIGTFDPFSKNDEEVIDAIVNSPLEIQKILDQYRDELESLGFSDEDIMELLQSVNNGEDLKHTLISKEYNGLVDTAYHNGVKFEVVLNKHDVLARVISDADGSACSHIAKSCDVRWTWFSKEHTVGHSSVHYAYNANYKWTRGYQGEAEASIDSNKIFLPNVEKNLFCGFCDGGEYCKSGLCNDHYQMCQYLDGGIPTWCHPTSDDDEWRRADCRTDNDCFSGRCEAHPNPFWAVLGYNVCYDRLPANQYCNENSDCHSGRCTWSWWWGWWTCD